MERVGQRRKVLLKNVPATPTVKKSGIRRVSMVFFYFRGSLAIDTREPSYTRQSPQVKR